MPTNQASRSGLLTVLVLAFSVLATSGAHAAACQGGASTAVRLKGAVKNPASYTLDDLRNFKLDPAKDYQPTTVTVTFNTSKGPVTATYTGVPLIDLLTVANVKVDKNQKNDILRKYVVAKATDCYEVVVALGEILANFEAKQVLVAYQDGDGQPLPESDGMARLVVPGDKAGGRSVFHLSQLIVRSAPK